MMNLFPILSPICAYSQIDKIKSLNHSFEHNMSIFIMHPNYL